MVGTQLIADGIEGFVKGNYAAWRVGITNDVEARSRYWSQTEKQNITTFRYWIADSLDAAQTVEAYFIDKGMQGGTGGDLSARQTVYVYI